MNQETQAFCFCECSHPGCRFRFPSLAAEAVRLSCPRCGHAITIAAPVRAAFGGKTAVSSPNTRPLTALLDNIRSIHNVGSIFRTADAAGLRHLYLCGITSTPAHPKLAKAALGAQETVAWSYHTNAVETAVLLQQQGHPLWALETGPTAQPLLTFRPTAHTQPPVLIVGNEKAGVDPGLLALCDEILQLPMLGHKESLNVAVAFGIAAYQLGFTRLGDGDWGLEIGNSANL